jgi:hypothetical protein
MFTSPNVVSSQESKGHPRQSLDNSTPLQILTDEEESTLARIERLGRARPEKFKSIWEEIGFCFSIVMSQVLTVCLVTK